MYPMNPPAKLSPAPVGSKTAGSGYAEEAQVDESLDHRMRLCRILLGLRLLSHAGGAGAYQGFVPLAIKTLERELRALGA